MQGLRFAVGVLVVLLAAGAQAGSLSLQGTYWDSDLAGEGYGGGIKLKRQTVEVVAVDFRASYLQFDDAKVNLVPVEGTVMLRLPFFIEPYLGVGMGYYYADAERIDSGFGYYAAAGLELHIMMLGLFAEVRQMELDGNALDGPSANAGVMLLW